MAEGKKSFVLYCDFIHTVNHLTDEQAGRLFKHILDYVNDKNPSTEDMIINLSFEPIKQQLKRDLKAWEGTRVDRSIAGKIGGIKSGESRRNKANEASASKSKQTQANEAVNVNANVTVNVNDTVNEEMEGATTKFSQESTSNAEETITKNQIEFQRICAGAGISFELGAEALHKYHLHLEEKNQYPKHRKGVFAGFEKWMQNEKNFIINRKNGTHQQLNGTGAKTKLGTSDSRVEALKKW